MREQYKQRKMVRKSVFCSVYDVKQVEEGESICWQRVYNAIFLLSFAFF